MRVSARTYMSSALFDIPFCAFLVLWDSYNPRLIKSVFMFATWQCTTVTDD